MLLVKSAALMQRTVAKYGFNIAYLKKGSILNIDIYNDGPFVLIGNQLSDSNSAYTIHIKKMDKAGGTFLYTPGNEDEKSYSFRWNQPFSISGRALF